MKKESTVLCDDFLGWGIIGSALRSKGSWSIIQGRVMRAFIPSQQLRLIYTSEILRELQYQHFQW